MATATVHVLSRGKSYTIRNASSHSDALDRACEMIEAEGYSYYSDDLSAVTFKGSTRAYRVEEGFWERDDTLLDG